jgi:hypothetical protein
MTPYSLVGVYQLFGGIYCLFLRLNLHNQFYHHQRNVNIQQYTFSNHKMSIRPMHATSIFDTLRLK